MIHNKHKPFKIPKISEEYPLYAKVLAPWIEDVEVLPNFDADESLLLLSDFGGEHKGANFKTYSFLILSKDKNMVFEKESKKLREEFNLNVPFKEICFKDLRYGPIKRILPDFLELADTYIHGVLFTLSIESNLDTVFGLSKKDAHRELSETLEKNKLGVWKGKDAEKLLRICHPLAMFMSLLSHDGQKFIWLCDHDTINADGKSRNFSHTQEVFSHVLNMYSDVKYDIYGFAKPFSDDSTTTDLLSLTDLTAGVIQEYLQEVVVGKDLEPTTEKKMLVEWLANKSKYLLKYNFIITKSDIPDSWDVGVVDLFKKI